MTVITETLKSIAEFGEKMRHNNILNYNKMENQKYIVRTDRAGVFFCEIESRNGSEAQLRNARRLWYWHGAASLSQLATEGVNRPNDCKFTVTVESCTVLGVIEIIPCTSKAVKSIENVKVWRV